MNGYTSGPFQFRDCGQDMIARQLRSNRSYSHQASGGLETSLEKAGYEIAYRWVPEETRDVYFLVATKPEMDTQKTECPLTCRKTESQSR